MPDPYEVLPFDLAIIEEANQKVMKEVDSGIISDYFKPRLVEGGMRWLAAGFSKEERLDTRKLKLFGFQQRLIEQMDRLK